MLNPKKTKTDVTSYPVSKISHNVVSSRYFVWLESNQEGFWPSGMGTAASRFGLAINNCVTPFNIAGGPGATLPSPLIANTFTPTGLKNFLNNSITGTGLYNNYRVWSVNITLTVQPQVSGDNVAVALCPIIGSANTYTNVLSAGQGPYCCTKICSASNMVSNNTINCHWSLPQILGVNNDEYSALSANTSGIYATPPTNVIIAEVIYNTLDQAVLNSNLPVFMKLRMHVEFFDRTDTVLLE